MKIIVKAKPNSKVCKVEEITKPVGLFSRNKDLRVFKVSVKEKPMGGAANEAIIEALADHFKTSKSQITLVSGGISKEKVFEISE